MTVHFPPEGIVPVIHADLIHRYGGHTGIRDKHLLASALAQPKMTIAKRFLHRTSFDKAAAYGYHICKNHPFIDGNKCVALVLMDIFLRENHWDLIATEEDAYSTIIALAAGKLSKAQLSSWLQKNSCRI